MKKLIAVAALALIATSAQAGTKLTYSRAELEAAGANDMPAIVERYVADTDRATLIHPAKVLFLVDGKPSQEAPMHLATADRVEVLTDGDALVVNVVTKPAKGGA